MCWKIEQVKEYNEYVEAKYEYIALKKVYTIPGFIHEKKIILRDPGEYGEGELNYYGKLAHTDGEKTGFVFELCCSNIDYSESEAAKQFRRSMWNECFLELKNQFPYFRHLESGLHLHRAKSKRWFGLDYKEIDMRLLVTYLPSPGLETAIDEFKQLLALTNDLCRSRKIESLKQAIRRGVEYTEQVEKEKNREKAEVKRAEEYLKKLKF